MKTCKKCGLPFSGERCKPCASKRQAAHRALHKERLKALRVSFYKANPERLRANTKKYYVANYEKIKVRNAKYLAENKEKVKARLAIYRLKHPNQEREYRAANPEKVRLRKAKYRAKNKEAFRIYDQNRKARIRKNGGTLSKGLVDKLLKLQRGKCPCCGKSLEGNYNLDHIVPIALGGQNIDSNIQLLTSQCNNQKHSKHPVDFMREKGFLI